MIKRKLILISIFISLILSAGTIGSAGKKSNAWDQLPVILERIKPPAFPRADFIITDYGAAGSGTADCTEAFKKAIDGCNAAGGGRVIVPAGTYITGAIQLKSNVNLYLSPGATVKFSQDYNKYLPVVLTRFEGVECYNYSPFIYAYNQTNIAITGSGTLNGSADGSHWWNWKSEGDSDRNALFSQGRQGVPVEQRIYGEGRKLRVNFIQPYKCTNVLIEGVTILQSPMWEIHPVLCTNVTVRNINVNSHGPNNDGCNPESCRDVLIKNCTFSTGDDCIAIKSGRNNDGRRVGAASENIIIQGVTCADGHGAVTFGSECSGDIRNVFVENCSFSSPNLNIAIRLKTNSERGGIMENFYFRNITVGVVNKAVIHATMNYEEGDAGDFTPVIRNMEIANLKSRKSPFALYLEGYERSKISNIKLTDCSFKEVPNPNRLFNVENIKFINTTINGIRQ